MQIKELWDFFFFEVSQNNDSLYNIYLMILMGLYFEFDLLLIFGDLNIGFGCLYYINRFEKFGICLLVKFFLIDSFILRYKSL